MTVPEVGLDIEHDVSVVGNDVPATVTSIPVCPPVGVSVMVGDAAITLRMVASAEMNNAITMVSKVTASLMLRRALKSKCTSLRMI
jgi:hypothetical protein